MRRSSTRITTELVELAEAVRRRVPRPGDRHDRNARLLINARLRAPQRVISERRPARASSSHNNVSRVHTARRNRGRSPLRSSCRRNTWAPGTCQRCKHCSGNRRATGSPGHQRMDRTSGRRNPRLPPHRFLSCRRRLGAGICRRRICHPSNPRCTRRRNPHNKARKDRRRTSSRTGQMEYNSYKRRPFLGLRIHFLPPQDIQRTPHHGKHLSSTWDITTPQEGVCSRASLPRSNQRCTRAHRRTRRSNPPSKRRSRPNHIQLPDSLHRPVTAQDQPVCEDRIVTVQPNT